MVLKTAPCRARPTFTHFAARGDMTDIIWFLLHRLFGCGLTKKAYTAKLPLTLTSRIAVTLYGSGMPNYQVGPRTCILLTLCRSYLHRWLLSSYCAMSSLRICESWMSDPSSSERGASALFLLATTARKLGDRRCQCLFAFVTLLNSVHGLICIIHTSLQTRRRHTPILGPHSLYISTY